MEFRILGPLEVLHEGVEVSLRGPLQRKALVMLLLDSGRTVPMHRLVAALWDGEPPATARRQVQNTVAALRRALAPDDPIERSGDGYCLTTGHLDLAAFRSETAQASAAAKSGDLAGVERLLEHALQLWRGPALAGVEGDLVASCAMVLEEEQWAAREDLFEARLALGHHRDIVPALRAAVSQQPYRQRLIGQLMLACYRAGDNITALQAYTALSDRLAEELGVEPDRALRNLYVGVLREQPELDLEPADTPTAHAIVPALLPPAPSAFTGRTTQVACLDAMLESCDGSSPRKGDTISRRLKCMHFLFEIDRRPVLE